MRYVIRVLILLWAAILAGLVTVLVQPALATAVGMPAHRWAMIALAAGVGGGASVAMVWTVGGRMAWDRLIAVAVVWAALAAAYQPGLAVWTAPRAWGDVLRLSEVAVVLAAMVQGWVALGYALWRKSLPPLRASVALLLIVAVGNILFVLQNPAMLQGLARTLPLAARGQELAGRVVVLAAANVGVAAALNLVCMGRVLGLGRLWGLLVLAAAAAGISPLWAELGASPMAAALPAPLPPLAAVLGVALAQGSLWAEVFLMTGLVMDAMHGRRPAWYWGYPAFRDGLGRGAAYGTLFLGLVLVADAVIHWPWVERAFAMAPSLSWMALGITVMPLAVTVLESFDGGRPFFQRLRENYRRWPLFVHGAVFGLALSALPPVEIVPLPAGQRFLLGALLGVIAGAGGALVWDLGEVACGLRRHLRSWRTYGVAAGLGVFVGGAMAWYLDPPQTAVIVNKFRQYATLFAAGGGDYVIYPLFSKWGAMNLGPRGGGALLLFQESVSGVINWSLAAPLFSVNFFVLTALFARSWAPLRLLASREGVVLVAEGTVRVLRWGLWMAPVIYSFLRISPDPTWYNQDGLVRTLAAIIQDWRLDPSAFRLWSREVFLSILAYDWFRILIWFDHMGLRVATLVNLSFVGGDRLDEFLARFLGARVRSRCIPEAVRRFATWAPLLIPFYLPMGADWAYVWDGAEAVSRTGAGQIGVLVPVMVLFLAGSGVMVFTARRRMSPACAVRAAGRCPAEDIVVHNGVYASVFGRDGRGYARVFRAARHGHEIDLTARPLSRAHDVGRIVYFRAGEALWSLGCRPTRHPDAVHTVVRLDDLSVRQTCSCQGIEARMDAVVAEDAPGEAWIVHLTNVSEASVQLEITSYRELTLNDPSAQARHPFYNRQHITTWCVVEESPAPRSAAILANNRQLKAGDPPRPTRETYVHLVAGLEDESRLVGYEDSRLRFLGHGTLRRPQGLWAAPQPVSDQSLHVTFDPIAAFRLAVDLAPGDTTAFVLVDAYGPTPEAAMNLAARLAGIDPLPARPKGQPTSLPMVEPDLAAALSQQQGPWFAFRDQVPSVEVPGVTPRRFAHLMVNPLGYGVVVTNDGAIASFWGNSQQNALTPYSADATTVQEPGQMLYVRDLENGRVTSPLLVPFREPEAECRVEYGLGWCRFHKKVDGLAMDWTIAVLPDRPMELRLLRLHNHGSKERRLALTMYAQMILAEIPEDSRGQVEAWADAPRSMLLFTRPENRYRKGVAYVAWNLETTASETVMSRFLGEGRDLSVPYFVEMGHSDTTQEDDGLRVAAMTGEVRVPAGGTTAVWMAVGQEPSAEDCQRRVAAIHAVEDVEREMAAAATWWQRRLAGGVQVETSAPAVDRLVNVWLPYQILTARLWGRLGPQQRSGAYGFRDQLQDVLPLCVGMPALARRQILLHASQQFLAGDVLQWWHPAPDGATGFGMRNRASDPHLWLPYLVAHYVETTGDDSIWDERVPFMEGRPIPPGAEGIAFAPTPSRDRGTVLEHCLRAVERTWRRRGRHGLPLMLAHDWNDGLSAVGVRGKGESVWLGFFLHLTLRQVAEAAASRGKKRLSRQLLRRAQTLGIALQTAWREDHFVRAFTDAGEELDYLDALTAAWPMLSGAVYLPQAEAALVRGAASLEKPNLVQLLDPPFTERSTPYPGRIADYPPGVRENGGQYSHGSSWLVDALVALARQVLAQGDVERAAQLRRQALRLWLKISPLTHTLPETMSVYGLAPHQQAADISFGPGYEGRGGWSWYTGAAARMLWAMYGILGLRFERGKPTVDARLTALNPELAVRRISVGGVCVYEASNPDVRTDQGERR